MSSFNAWLATVNGKKLGNGDCGQVPYSWASYLNPSLPHGGLPTVTDSKDFAGFSGNGWTWIANNHNDPNQVPVQGDVMVFGATPASGYTNTYPNPAGHSGVCDSATSATYTLVQQNAPSTGEGVNVTTYPWKFRPCLGWIHYGSYSPPAPTPSPTPAPAQTITLPATTGPWHLYEPGGPYNPNNAADVLGQLVPSKFPGGLTYTILATLGNGVYRIHSSDFGTGDIWTSGSNVHIS